MHAPMSLMFGPTSCQLGRNRSDPNFARFRLAWPFGLQSGGPKARDGWVAAASRLGHCWAAARAPLTCLWVAAGSTLDRCWHGSDLDDILDPESAAKSFVRSPAAIRRIAAGLGISRLRPQTAPTATSGDRAATQWRSNVDPTAAWRRPDVRSCTTPLIDILWTTPPQTRPRQSASCLARRVPDRRLCCADRSPALNHGHHQAQPPPIRAPPRRRR